MARTNIQLYDIADVNIQDPATGEVVTYNGTSWVNSPTSPTNKIVQRDSELSINDVDGAPSSLDMTIDSVHLMKADSDKIVFQQPTTAWISYVF